MDFSSSDNLDTSMDNSHYQSALSTPVKEAVCQVTSSDEEPDDQQGEGSFVSSLASTSLDFSCPADDEDDDDDLQPFFTTAIEESDLQSTASSPTLVEERLKNVTLNEPPLSPQLPFASTNPFVDNFCPQVSTDEQDIRRLLSNLHLMSSRLTEVESAQKHLTDQLSGLCRSAQQINQESARILEKLLHKEKVVSSGQQTPKVDAQTQTETQTECIESESQCESPTVEPDISTLQHRFRKLPALVKGYLVRRLMHTDKVVNLKRTITDTSRILVQFKTNLLRESGGKLVVTHSDISFHKRLCDQLEAACRQFYAVFIELPTARRLEIIAQHREHLKQVKYLESRRTGMTSSSSSSIFSSSVASSRPVSGQLHYQRIQQNAKQQPALLNLT